MCSSDLILGNRNFLDSLANLYELRGSRLRMRLQLVALRPLVCCVVVRDVAEQETCVGAMHDEPNISTDADRPEVHVFRTIELMKLEARVSRIKLQIERGSLDRLLLFASQSCQAIG